MSEVIYKHNLVTVEVVVVLSGRPSIGTVSQFFKSNLFEIYRYLLHTYFQFELVVTKHG